MRVGINTNLFLYRKGGRLGKQQQQDRQSSNESGTESKKADKNKNRSGQNRDIRQRQTLGGMHNRAYRPELTDHTGAQKPTEAQTSSLDNTDSNASASAKSEQLRSPLDNWRYNGSPRAVETPVSGGQQAPADQPVSKAPSVLNDQPAPGDQSVDQLVSTEPVQLTSANATGSPINVEGNLQDVQSTQAAQNLQAVASQRQPVLFGTQLNLVNNPGELGLSQIGALQLVQTENLTARSNEVDNPFTRIAPQDPSRAPGVNALPNPREISNVVMSESFVRADPLGSSDLLWQWGQFIDHDMTLTAVTDAGDPIERAPIDVPKGDQFLDPDGTGTQQIPFDRSAFTLDADGQRQQVNILTPLLDGSQVYGSDAETETELRSFANGRLETTAGRKLPLDDTGRFIAGDERVNEQPGLTAMHTLFVREHNKLAREFARKNGCWSDEQIYQAAKARNIAQMQSITYNEFLPTILGKDSLQPYKGFDDNADASISNEFATAAFRFGHSMVTADITRIRRNGKELTEPLADNFENPRLIREGNIGSVIRGQAFTPGNELDNEVTGSLRNLLFGPPGTPGGGLDLAALNIQRGRDHELSSYNDTREAIGMERITSWHDPIFRDGVGEKLSQAYEHPDDIDLWVGGLSEVPDGDSFMGTTFTAINAKQFEQLRDSDPDYFENNFYGHELADIQSTTLADIIRRNSNVKDVQDDALLTPEYV